MGKWTLKVELHAPDADNLKRVFAAAAKKIAAAKVPEDFRMNWGEGWTRHYHEYGESSPGARASRNWRMLE